MTDVCQTEVLRAKIGDWTAYAFDSKNIESVTLRAMLS
jgi:hypothetical protein